MKRVWIGGVLILEEQRRQQGTFDPCSRNRNSQCNDSVGAGYRIVISVGYGLQ